MRTNLKQVAERLRRSDLTTAAGSIVLGGLKLVAERLRRSDSGDAAHGTERRSRSATSPVLAAARFAFSALLLCLAASLAAAAGWEKTVAQDGSGDYKTVREAVLAAPTATRDAPSIIRVKKGIYKERLYLQREKRFVKLLGSGAQDTVIVFHLNANLPGDDGLPISTYRTPTVSLDSDDFTVEDITFANSAGPVGQALALKVDGDRVVFRRCRFLGWQDTIHTNRGRQYFEDCYIEGHVDFIFGGSTTYFERCQLHALKDGYLTAASTPPEQAYGYVFNHCRITGAEGVRTWLGRPWRIHASTWFLNTEMSEVVRPEGWNDWGKPEAHATARYGEFNNTGPGAAKDKRASWARQLDAAEAARITVESVLGGSDAWDPRRP
jgi:pectinesterase